jgi:hypothetical protein
MVCLPGGPSHIDMYDLKPDAPVEVRGEFKPIATNVPGIQIGEHLPMQAKIMDKLAIVRSAYHTNAGHGMGSQWMQTGYQATIEVNDNIYPSTGSVVAKMNGANDPLLPPYLRLKQRFGGNEIVIDRHPDATDDDVHSSVPGGSRLSTHLQESSAWHHAGHVLLFWIPQCSVRHLFYRVASQRRR